jgi:hypothetical protein
LLSVNIPTALTTLVDGLKQNILEGEIILVFEEYYAEGVVMQDNDRLLRAGVDASSQHN